MSGRPIEMKPTINQQIQELERELTMRKQVFPKWVAARKLKQNEMDWRIACIEATIKVLREMP